MVERSGILQRQDDPGAVSIAADARYKVDRDRDSKCGRAFRRRLLAIGIGDRRIGVIA
jgi:hypothetical protein